MNKHDILYIGMNSYRAYATGTVNRNAEVLRELQAREDVGRILFIDAPPHTLKRAARYALSEFPYYRARYQDLRTQAFGLYQINEKLFLYSSTRSAINERGFWNRVARVMAALEMRAPIVWSANPLFTGWLDALPHTTTVFDCVDNWAEHSVYAHERDRLTANYSTIAKRADVIFTVSRELLSLFPNHPSAHAIFNGVRPFDHVAFHQATQEKIRVGYVGVIQDRIDTAILDELSAHADIRVTLFGPVWNNFDAARYATNPFITFTKQLAPHDQLPELLRKQDVMIIPHRNTAFTRSMNPMKLYDYLACGKPVVSTPLADLAPDLAPFVHIASTPQEFLAAVRAAAKENSQQEQLARMQATAAHTWTKKVHEMMSYVTHL